MKKSNIFLSFNIFHKFIMKYEISAILPLNKIKQLFKYLIFPTSYEINIFYFFSHLRSKNSVNITQNSFYDLQYIFYDLIKWWNRGWRY